mgnify:CR=1 FL=1
MESQDIFVFQMQKQLHTSLSYSSSCVSASEFFDAEEYQLHHDGQGGRDGSDTSSEAGSLTSEEGSISSENSEIGTEYTPAQSCKYSICEIVDFCRLGHKGTAGWLGFVTFKLA